MLEGSSHSELERIILIKLRSHIYLFIKVNLFNDNFDQENITSLFARGFAVELLYYCCCNLIDVLLGREINFIFGLNNEMI